MSIARRQPIKVTDEEKKFFDNITYDEITACKDLKKLDKLEKYMRQEHFPTTADYVKSRIVTLGGTPDDPEHPTNRAAAEEDLKSFREELTSWETNMKMTEQELAESKLCQNGKPAGKSGPPIRSIAADKKKPAALPSTKKEETMSEKEKRRIQQAEGDLRSGRNYYDEWDKFAKDEETRLDEEAKKAEARRAAAAEAEKEVPLEDDGGTGIAKQLRAMEGLTPAEKQWQANREKEKGNECFKAKEYSNCVNHYSLSLKLCPGVAAVHTNRAAAYLKLKRWEDAEQDCTYALEGDRTNFKALMRRGAARIEMDTDGAIEGAVEDIEAALEMEPENKELKALHEKASRKVRHFIDRQQAKQMTRCVIEEVDDSDEEDEDEEAPAKAEEKAADDGEKRRRVLIEEDSDEEEEDDDDDEEEDVTELLRKNKKPAEEEAPPPPPEKTCAELAEEAKNEGNDFFKKGDYSKADACYTRSLELLPATVPVLSNRAMCRIKMGKFKDAEVDADLALALDPSFIKGHHRRGAARVGLGKKKEALEDYRAVLRAMPDTPGLKAEAAKLEEELEESTYVAPRSGPMIVEVEEDSDDEEDAGAKAAEEKEAAAKAAKEKAELAARVEAEKKKKAAAEAKAKAEGEARAKAAEAAKAEAEKESRSLELKDKGNDAFKAGQFQQAVEFFTQSLTLFPRSAAVLGNRTAAYLKLGKHELAEKDATAVLALEPANMKALHRRATARMSLSAHAKALKDLKQVLEAMPTNKQVLADVAACEEALARANAPEVPVSGLTEPFYACKKFIGKREGYAFKTGGKGLGYYVDDAEKKAKAEVEKKAKAEAEKKAKAEAEKKAKAEADKKAKAEAEAKAKAEAEKAKAEAEAKAKAEAEKKAKAEAEAKKKAGGERKRIVIEEDSEDEDEEENVPPTPAAKAAPPTPAAAGQRKRIMIEEDSDEEEEEASSSAAAPPPTPAAAPRKRIMIEEDSDEEEDEAASAAAKAAAEKAERAKLEAEAERLKTEGNTHFKNGKVEASIASWTESLKLVAANAPVYANRSAAYMKLGKHAEAEADAHKAVGIDASYVKAYHRRGAARRALGQLDAALKDLEHVQSKLPGNKQVADEIKSLKQQMKDAVLASAAAKPAAPAAATAKAKKTEAAAAEAKDGEKENEKPSKEEAEAKAAAAAAAVASKYLSRLPVPKTSAEFERSAKALAADPTGLGAYVRQIEPEIYAKLFKDSLNAPILNSILTALEGTFLPEGDSAGAVGVLQALSKVPRFSMAVMLLPKKEKTLLASIFDKLQAGGANVGALRKAYKA